jgi:hypothetical protein
MKILIVISLLFVIVFVLFLREEKKEKAFYRVKDGIIEKSVSVLGGSGEMVWKSVENQMMVNCSGSHPDLTYWTKEDFERKKKARKE